MSDVATPAYDSRLHARLTALPHKDLVRMLVQVARCASFDAEQSSVVERGIATSAPLPAWVVDQLHSPDVLSSVFIYLQLTDCAAARVCASWNAAWASHVRGSGYVRGFHPLCIKPTGSRPFLGLTTLPGGLLALGSIDDSCIHTLTHNGYVQRSFFENLSWPRALAYHDGALFVCVCGDEDGEDDGDISSVRKIRLRDGALLARANVSSNAAGNETLSHPDLHFIAVYMARVYVLDSHTPPERTFFDEHWRIHTFDTSLAQPRPFTHTAIVHPTCITTTDDALLVALVDRFLFFSAAGELLRSVDTAHRGLHNVVAHGQMFYDGYRLASQIC